MSTRRGNREGSIVRRGKRFWGRISLPQPDGTYRSVSVTRDSRKAVRDELGLIVPVLRNYRNYRAYRRATDEGAA